MQKLFNKVAPLGVMMVCVIWCCWSQLRESTPLLAATEAKLPRIERGLLHPELSPVSARDPFLQYKPEPPPVSEEPAAQIKVEEKPPFNPHTVLPSIRLDATILGRKPLAVINGKMHNEGDIVVLESAPEVYCRLQRVHSDGILMAIEDRTFLIGYSNASREVTAAAPAADAAGPLSDGGETALPEGIPHTDELESAVAHSLANQPSPTDDQDHLNSDQTPGLPVHTADEECEYEKDLLNTNKFDELRNDYDE